MYYLYYFFIYSIIGYLIETFILNKESGILLGPWAPIYGLGAIIILLIYKYINKKPLNKVTKYILLFLSCFFILTILELIGGYLIELIFNTTFWDYSNYKFNIGKYISLEVSLTWGICSIILIHFLKPITDKFIKIIPTLLIYSLIIIFITDIIYTLNLK